MSDIPADVMDAAREVFVNLPLGHEVGSVEVIARAILAERQRADKDAKRYRWLRDGNAYAPEENFIDGYDALDELCDDGIAETSGGKP